MSQWCENLGLWASCPADGINPSPAADPATQIQLSWLFRRQCTCASQEMNSIPIHLNQLHFGKACASSWLHPFPLAASSWYSGQRPFHRSFGKWDVEESWRFNSYDWLRSGIFLHVTVASSLLPSVTEPLSSQFPNLCLSGPAVTSKIAAAVHHSQQCSAASFHLVLASVTHMTPLQQKDFKSWCRTGLFMKVLWRDAFYPKHQASANRSIRRHFSASRLETEKQWARLLG